MTEYEGLFAEFYDVLHPHALEAPNYVRFARESGGSVLELGCGTGRLLIPLAREGVRITGLDNAPDMLELCRRKLLAEPEEVRRRVTLVAGDLREFVLEEEFALVFLACDTARHLLESEDAIRCFVRAREALAPNGRLVVDTSLPDLPAMVEANGKEETGEFEHPETGHRFCSRFRAEYDFLRQRERNEIQLTEIAEGEVVSRARARTELTWFHPRELEVLLGTAGMRVVERFGSHRRDPLGPESRELILVATPAPES
jgi:SAM-dependent methyltransferase